MAHFGPFSTVSGSFILTPVSYGACGSIERKNMTNTRECAQIFCCELPVFNSFAALMMSDSVNTCVNTSFFHPVLLEYRKKKNALQSRIYPYVYTACTCLLNTRNSTFIPFGCARIHNSQSSLVFAARVSLSDRKTGSHSTTQPNASFRATQPNNSFRGLKTAKYFCKSPLSIRALVYVPTSSRMKRSSRLRGTRVR